MTCEDKDSCYELNLEQMRSAHIERLLIAICNEFMAVNGNGQFQGHKLADEINVTLGIA